MDIASLVNLTTKAWCLPILAQMHRGVPGRQAALIAATGAGRSAFSPSLKHLIDLGYVVRNSGHGHPLRAEFNLTPTGKIIGATAQTLFAHTQDVADQALLRRMWTLPLLRVSQEPRAFGDFKTLLPPITDRALSLSLQRLERSDWIRRDVNVASRPARAHYVALGTGRDLGQALLI